MGEYAFWAVLLIIAAWIYSWLLSWLRQSIFGHPGWHLADVLLLPFWLAFEFILLIINLMTLFTIASVVYDELKKFQR